MLQFVGGYEEAVKRIHPVMELMGPLYYMGTDGSGSITKLASNQLWPIHAIAMGEALVMAVKSCVDLW